MSRYFFEPLNVTHHNIKIFESGNEHLDNIIRAGAGGYGRTYVVVSRRGSRTVLAIIALLPERQLVARATTDVGTEEFICLNILAVAKRYQRRGIGKWVITELVREIVQASENSRLKYLVIVPFDEAAKRYYEHLNWNFETSPTGNLVLRVEVMRGAIGKIALRRTRSILKFD